MKSNKEGERAAWPSSCSRNAHDQNVLVPRAQSRIDQATLENELEDWDNARSQGQPDHSLEVRFRGETGSNSKAFSQIFWLKTCHLGEAGQHTRTDLVAIMKREDDIGPPSPL